MGLVKGRRYAAILVIGRRVSSLGRAFHAWLTTRYRARGDGISMGHGAGTSDSYEPALSSAEREVA